LKTAKSLVNSHADFGGAVCVNKCLELAHIGVNNLRQIFQSLVDNSSDRLVSKEEIGSVVDFGEVDKLRGDHSSCLVKVFDAGTIGAPLLHSNIDSLVKGANDSGSATPVSSFSLAIFLRKNAFAFGPLVVIPPVFLGVECAPLITRALVPAPEAPAFDTLLFLVLFTI